VEHTVTEEVTGIDILKSQVMMAQGMQLSRPAIDISSQRLVKIYGFALQCRVTTEYPENNFMSDYGRVAHYPLPAAWASTWMRTAPFQERL
jgi:pyruvate carboxylase